MSVNANLSRARVARQTENTVAVSGSITEAMLVKSIEISGNTEALAREDLRNSLDGTSTLSGKWSATASIEQNILPNGTPGTKPEIDYLLDGLLGNTSTSTSGTITSGASTTSFDVDAPGSFTEKDLILVGVGAGNTMETTQITDITSDTITVSPALSTTPSNGDAITAGVTYSPAISGQEYLSIEKYVNSLVRQVLVGGRVNSGDFTFESGAIGTVSWSLEGIYTTESNEAPSGTDSYDSGAPPVALGCKFLYNGVEKNTASFSVSVNNNLERHDILNSTYGTASIENGRRDVSGSVTLETPSTSTEFFDDMVAKTSVQLFFTIGVLDANGLYTAGKTIAVCIPEAQLTSKNMETASVAKDTVEWTAFSTAGETSIYLSFL